MRASAVNDEHAAFSVLAHYVPYQYVVLKNLHGRNHAVESGQATKGPENGFGYLQMLLPFVMVAKVCRPEIHGVLLLR
jgi:hypothetical protein